LSADDIISLKRKPNTKKKYFNVKRTTWLKGYQNGNLKGYQNRTDNIIVTSQKQKCQLKQK